MISVGDAHRACARAAGYFALILARPKERPEAPNFIQMADELERVAAVLRQRAAVPESPPPQA